MGEQAHNRIDALSIWWNAAQTTIEAYLIRGKINALIDSGPPQGSSDTISPVLEVFNLTSSDIDLVLNTHGHTDHIGGNAALKAAGRAKIMIHREDVIFLEDHGRSFDQFYAAGREGDLVLEKAGFVKELGPEVLVDQRLEDMDHIEVGDGVMLTVIHLPGHTPGSAGYYWEKEGVLFCGDAVPGLNTPGGSLPIIYDFKGYEKSILRLMEMPLETIYFCHPYRGLRLPPSKVRQGKEVIKEYLSDSLGVLRRLDEAIQRHEAKRGAKPFKELADDIIGDMPPNMGFKRASELPMPQFSLGTIYRGLFRT